MPLPNFAAYPHDAPLTDDEIENLQCNAQSFPFSNHAHLRLIATAGELHRVRQAIKKMREGLETLKVT